MSERITSSYDDALYKSTYTLLYINLICCIVKLEVWLSDHCVLRHTMVRQPPTTDLFYANPCICICAILLLLKMYLRLQLDGNYSERVQLPVKVCHQHWVSVKVWLSVSGMIVRRSIKCKQSPVYGFFWTLLPHPSTDRKETRTWSSLSPKEPSHKIWYKFVHNFFSYRYRGHRQTHRQTDTKTNACKNILPRFRRENKAIVDIRLRPRCTIVPLTLYTSLT